MIDNFSRRILAWNVAGTFEPAITAPLLRDAAEAPAIGKPTLLHIAEEDGFVNKEAQAKIRDGLADHPKISIHSYPGVDHAFGRINGVNYDAAAAKLADSRTVECLNANLG